MSTKITDIFTSDLIFKKFLGNAGAYPGASYALEVGNARPNVFSSLQIFSQSIPLVAPTDFVITSYLWGSLSNGSYTSITSTTTNTSPANDLINIGQILTSTSYPYIQKIVGLHLSPITLGTSYRFADPTKSIINYLNQTIPNNTDVKTGTYSYTLNSSNGFTYGSSTNISFPSNSTPNWFIDTDVGYLYFPNNDWNQSHNPVISFYRYNGSIGLNSSTSTETQDPWLLTNLIGAPPAVVLDTPIQETNDIYITFKYPTQIPCGFMNSYLPVLTAFNIKIDDTITPYTNNGNNIYIKTKPDDKAVTCIHFSNLSNITAGYKANGYNGNPEFVIKDNLDNPKKLSVWYSNYNTSFNVSNLISDIKYFVATNPNAISGFSVTAVGSTVNTYTISFSFNSPSASGVTSPNLTYDVTFIPFNNTKRYNGIFNTNINSSTPLLSNTLSSPVNTSSPTLYPDTTFKIKITSTNLSNLSTDFTSGETTTATSAYALSNYFTTNSSVSLSLTSNTTNIKSAKKVSDSTSVSVLINKTDISFTTGVFLAHNSTANRGYSGNLGLVFINSNLSGGSLSSGITMSSDLAINGFPLKTNYLLNFPVSSTQLQLTATTSDNNGTTINQLSNYYSNVAVTSKVSFANITLSESPTPLTHNVVATYYGSNSRPAFALANSGGINNITQTFTNNDLYYDGPVPTPTCVINSLTINTVPILQISGITLYNDAITVTPNITVGNIGTNFYNATKTVEYSGSIGITATVKKNDGTSTTETGLPSGYISSTKSGTFTNPLTFSKISGIYSTSLSLTATAYAISGNGVAGSKSLNIIYDTNSVLVSSINNVDNLAHISGCRVWSGTSVGNEAVGATTLATLTSSNNNSFSSVANSAYNNAKDISNLLDTYKYELLFANNAYTTYTTYMINYQTYLNGPNYLSLKDATAGLLKGSIYYRYATFAWKVNTQNLGSTGFSNIQFILSSYFSNQTVSVTNGGSLQIGTSLPFLYYRVEDSTNITDFTNSASTPWINGNLFNNGTKISSSNFTSTSTNYSGLDSTTSITIGSDIIFNTILPNPLKNSSGSSVYIYCRIGIPISVQFSFQDIKCKLL